MLPFINIEDIMREGIVDSYNVDDFTYPIVAVHVSNKTFNITGDKTTYLTVAELITATNDRTFAGAGNWVAIGTDASVAVAGGDLDVTVGVANTGAQLPKAHFNSGNGFVNGVTYNVLITIASLSAGTVIVKNGTQVIAEDLINGVGQSLEFTAKGNRTELSVVGSNAAATFSIDNISIKPCIKLQVRESTGNADNDSQYNVVSSSYSAPNTTIVVDETISAQTEYFTTAKDRTFAGGSTHWADVDLGGSFNDTDDLSLLASATGQYCKITLADIGTALVSGKKYVLTYDYAQATAGYEFKLVGASTQTLGDAVVGTGNTIEFTAAEDYETTDYLGIFAKTGATAEGDFDNFSITIADGNILICDHVFKQSSSLPYNFSGFYVSNDGIDDLTITITTRSNLQNIIDAEGNEMVLTLKPNETINEDIFNGAEVIKIDATDEHRSYVRANYQRR